MIKRLLATSILLVLFGFVVYSLTSEGSENDSKDELVGGEDQVMPTTDDVPTGLKVGELAPDFELTSLKGEKVKLSDFKGKKVFLNFWATWCPPCRVEMPEMQRFHDKYGDEAIIIAVNGTGSETNVDTVKGFIDGHGYTFLTLLDKEMTVHNQYAAISIPTTYYIGTDGKIQLPRHVGPMDFKMMEEKFKKLK